MARRWLVDGMNVIGSRPDGWWNDPDRAMRTLTKTLERFAAATGDRVTVVFDKRPRSGAPSSETIEVCYAKWKGRNAADHEIEVIVEEEEDPASLLVVTSDKRLREKVTALGAPVVGSGSFREQMESETPPAK